MPHAAITTVSIAAGAALVCAGLWVLRASAMPRRDAGSEQALPARGMTFATRCAVGLSLMFGGYHIAAWGSPPEWLELRVPLERWYLLVGGIAIAVGLSIAMDRLSQRDVEHG